MNRPQLGGQPPASLRCFHWGTKTTSVTVVSHRQRLRKASISSKHVGGRVTLLHHHTADRRTQEVRCAGFSLQRGHRYRCGRLLHPQAACMCTSALLRSLWSPPRRHVFSSIWAVDAEGASAEQPMRSEPEQKRKRALTSHWL